MENKWVRNREQELSPSVTNNFGVLIDASFYMHALPITVKNAGIPHFTHLKSGDVSSMTVAAKPRSQNVISNLGNVMSSRFKYITPTRLPIRNSTSRGSVRTLVGGGRPGKNNPRPIEIRKKTLSKFR
jgi:hypothetical protein